jgi:hypothetical protein
LNTKLFVPSKSGTWTSRWAEQKRKIQIAELEEWREKAYHSANLYKERTKRWHDKRVKTKQFKSGDKILLFNSRVHLVGHGKLHSKWEGPYLVLHAMDHDAVTLQCNDGFVKEVQHPDSIANPVLVPKRTENGGCALITQA